MCGYNLGIFANSHLDPSLIEKFAKAVHSKDITNMKLFLTKKTGDKVFPEGGPPEAVEDRDNLLEIDSNVRKHCQLGVCYSKSGSSFSAKGAPP